MKVLVKQARLEESLRYEAEYEYVNRRVREALKKLIATYDGKGSSAGLSGDKASGVKAKKKLDQMLRMREKAIQARYVL